MTAVCNKKGKYGGNCPKCDMMLFVGDASCPRCGATFKPAKAQTPNAEEEETNKCNCDGNCGDDCQCKPKKGK